MNTCEPGSALAFPMPRPFGVRFTIAATRAPGQPLGHLPAGIEKTFVPDSDANLASITAAVYGKDTPQGENALEMANFALQKSHSIAALIKAGRFRQGQSLAVPWNPDEQKTVRDWLDAAAHDYNWIQYRAAWWKDAKYCNLVWIGGTFTVVGVIWPIMIALLTGAGLGGHRVKKSDYDLARFGSGKSTPATMPGRKSKELDEAGQRQLAAMNQALTDSLKDSISTSGAPAKPAAAAAAAPHIPSPLAAEPLAPPPPSKQEEEKEFSGQFYPVAHPVAKPAETKPDPQQPPGQPKKN
jgi:hypothetical protein